jgi:3-methyladenine DNA glycosylase AlkD
VDNRELIRRFRAVPADTASLRARRKVLSRELVNDGRAEVLALAGALINSQIPRFVAYEIVLNHRPTMEALTQAEIEKLGEGMRQWGDIDAFACFVAGPAWRAGRVSGVTVQRWARSPDWCWRRAALVSTVPLNCKARGGQGDTRRTLEVCGILVGDRHDLVVKALSWALRELTKRDPESVSSFLSEHADTLAPRVRREVISKLTTGIKNPSRTQRVAR